MISICIPTYNNAGAAHDATYNNLTMLGQLFESIEAQTFKDYETIVSDHSRDDSVSEMCERWAGRIHIRYTRFERKYGSCEANLNNAMSLARRKYVKPMLQDDYFNSPHALQQMFDALESRRGAWVVSGCTHINENDTAHTFNQRNARLADPFQLLMGVNTIGSPIVLMHVNDNSFYDEFLIWLMDVEFYYRLNLRYGPPLSIDEPLLVSRIRQDGITNTMITEKLVGEEQVYCQRKLVEGKVAMTPEDFPAMYERIVRTGLL